MRQTIFSEDPVRDQWKWLLRYAYPRNIEHFLLERGLQIEKELLDTISGSFQQAEEYFKLGAGASLFVAPTLLYYGATHLLFAAVSILTGKVAPVRNHGLRLNNVSLAGRLGEISVIPCNPTDGAFTLYSDYLCPEQKGQLHRSGDWSLCDLFGSIPDLEEDFRLCYPSIPPHVIPVEIVDRQLVTIERIKGQLMQVFGDDFQPSSIYGLKESYLQPAWASPHPSTGQQFLILRRCLSFRERGIYDLAGRKYLVLYHAKGGQRFRLHQISAFEGGLYLLGHLARYHPQRWYSFVRTDSTGERHLLERFLLLAVRSFPNQVLNLIEGKSITFSPQPSEATKAPFWI